MYEPRIRVEYKWKKKLFEKLIKELKTRIEEYYFQ